MAVLVIALLSAACEARATDKYVLIDVDGAQLQQSTSATTVAGALQGAGIELAPLDRVQPDLNEPLERSTHIIVTRVREELSHEERTLPFPRTLLRDESMADGTSRVLQLGVNGREALTYRTLYENDQETSRELVSQQAVEIPREEIVVVGAMGLLKSVPTNGSIIYLSNNNGWLMRDASGSKRPLTAS